MDDLRGEQGLRAAVHAKLLSRAAASDTLVIDEMGLLNGQCRVDIAVINGHLRGIELKSRDDTLDRLPSQIQCYGRVVDCATLIVDEKYAEPAERMLPEWWGLILVRQGQAGQGFRRLKPERANRGQSPADIARLLWKSEAVTLLVRCTGDLGWHRKRRAELYEALGRGLPLRRLKAEVRAALKRREHWRDLSPRA